MADMPSAGSRPVSGREKSYLSSYLISQTVWKITVPSASFEDEGNTIPWNVRITHPATWHHISEELDLQNHCCENLIFGMMLLVWQHTTHTISYFCTFVLVTGYAWVNVQSDSYRTHASFLPVILKRPLRSTAWSCPYCAWIICRNLNRWHCVHVLWNYRPQRPRRSIWINLYSYMDCPMR